MASIRSLRTKIFILLVLTAYTHAGRPAAQSSGSRSHALASVLTALCGDMASSFYNPACMPSGRSGITTGALRYFGIPELTDKSLWFSMPLSGGILGGGLQHFGYTEYAESTFHLSAAWPAGWVVPGIAVFVRQESFGGSYQREVQFGVNGSLLINAFQNAGFVMRGYNLTGISKSRSDPVRQELAAGIFLKPAESIQLFADLVKDLHFPLSVRTAVEFEVLSGVDVRAGVGTEPRIWSAGIGLHRKHWQVSIGLQQHHLLGMSPGIDLSLFR